MSNQDGENLLDACQVGEFDRARSLVSSGTSVDYQDEDGHTPAYCCCSNEHANILQFIIDQGGDLNRSASNGETAVYISASKNTHQCLALLLQSGAEKDRALNNGATPVYISAQQNSHQCLALLLQDGADANRADNDGFTPLHIAAYYNSSECMTLLLLPQYAVAVDAVSALGWTALWYAAFQGHQLIAEMLVQGRANIDIAANDGKTAIDIAREKGHPALARYLDAESKWRRRGAFVMVLSSIQGAPTDSKAMKVLQCYDLGREITTYL